MSSPSARALGILATAGLALGLTGCGVRLDTPPPPVPTADAAELARSAAVADAEAIAGSAQALTASQDPASPVADVLTQLASGSAQHASSLGGEWTPPARPSPSATPTGGTDSSADDGVASPATTTGELVAALGVASTQAAAQASASPSEQAELLVSISVWRALAARQLAAVSADADPSTVPTGGTDLLAVRLATVNDVDALIRGVDAAAFGYEALAARQDDAARQTDWIARASLLRRTGQTLATSAGVAGTAADPREAIYDVADVLALDAAAAAVTLETQIATLWITAPVPAGLRPTAAQAAIEALGRAANLAPLAALDSPAAVLPGLGSPA